MKLLRLFGLIAILLLPALTAVGNDKRIVLVAGRPSHALLQHEHNAGVLLLKKCLDEVPGIEAVAHLNGWPDDGGAFDGADAIVLYMDGGKRHPALQENRLEELDRLMRKGVGLACIHYAVEPTREKGQKEFLDWIGGCFESHWSVNPHWTADFKELPDHPITRGVKPFKINDEWYYNMRFRDNMEGVIPILSAIPPESTLERPDGSHSGNPHVRAMVGQTQHVAWAYERPGGGRGFGFTGAHNHLNWGNDDFRKIVLNAIVWIANGEVPPNGVESAVTHDELMANLDPK